VLVLSPINDVITAAANTLRAATHLTRIKGATRRSARGKSEGYSRAAARLLLGVTRERQALRTFELHCLQSAGVEVQRLQDGRRHLAEIDRRRNRPGAGLRPTTMSGTRVLSSLNEPCSHFFDETLDVL